MTFVLSLSNTAVVNCISRWDFFPKKQEVFLYFSLSLEALSHVSHPVN